MMTFISDIEKEIGDEFLEKGYVIKDVIDRSYLDKIRSEIFFITNNKKSINDKEVSEYLNFVHKTISSDNLNNFRIDIFNNLNDRPWLRSNYYNSAKSFLDLIVGNELCMQRRVNLSIQMPNDKSSLLALHSDVWSGDSPFEVVAWIPLVDCYDTKSMYIMNSNYSKEFYSSFSDYSNMSTDEIFEKIKDNVTWIKIKYGQVLIFDQSIPHGNVVNNTKETRWSMNCRFKSVFSPYGDKKLGDFFDPISLKAATKMGMGYVEPKIEK